MIILPVPVVVGFSETSYTVSESEGTATVTVEILEGTVADDSITVQFSTRDNTALRRFLYIIVLLCDQNIYSHLFYKNIL